MAACLFVAASVAVVIGVMGLVAGARACTLGRRPAPHMSTPGRG
jgi:hypothetical protein